MRFPIRSTLPISGHPRKSMESGRRLGKVRTSGPRSTEIRRNFLSPSTRCALTEPWFRDISPAVPLTEIAVVPTYGRRPSGLSDARAISSRTCENRGLALWLPIDTRKHNGWYGERSYVADSHVRLQVAPMVSRAASRQGLQLGGFCAPRPVAGA